MDGVVFAFGAYYRNTNPVRFQLWRPVDTVRVPGSARSAETTVRLLSQLRVTPSVQDSRETVRIIIIIIIITVVVVIVVVVVHLLGNVYSHKVKYAHR